MYRHSLADKASFFFLKNSRVYPPGCSVHVWVGWNDGELVIFHSWGQALKDDLPPDNLPLCSLQWTGWSCETARPETYDSWLLGLTVIMNTAAAPQRKKRKDFIPYFLGFVIFLYCTVQLVSFTATAAQQKHRERLRRALGKSHSSERDRECVLFWPLPIAMQIVWNVTVGLWFTHWQLVWISY